LSVCWTAVGQSAMFTVQGVFFECCCAKILVEFSEKNVSWISPRYLLELLTLDL